MDNTDTSTSDKLLEDLGGCGTFQVILVIIFLFAIIPAIFGFLVDTFGLYNPGWRCLDNITDLHAPILDNGTNEFSSTTVDDFTLWNTTLMSSSDNSSSKLPLSEYGLHTCDLYKSCQRVEFSPDASTYVTEWGLACDSAWILSTILSLRMAGNMVSTFIVGYIGDRFGRKTPMMIGIVIKTIVLNLIAIFSTSWQMYAVVAFFLGCTASFHVLFGTLRFEYIPESWRIKVSSIPVWTITSILFSVTAMLLHDWKNIRILTLGLGVVAIIPLFWVPKSIRWLSVKGKEKECQKVVRKIARINKTEIPERFRHQDGVHSSLDKKPEHEIELIERKDQQKFNKFEMNGEHGNAVVKDGKQKMKSYTVLSLFRRKKYRIPTLIIGLVVFSIDTIYYALSFGVIALPGNLYVNMILSSVTELPANFISFFFANLFKRKPMIFSTFLLASFGLISVVLVDRTATDPDVQRYATISLVMLIKLLLFVGWIIFDTSIMESYPTVIRTTIKSYVWFTGAMGGIVAPYLIPSNPDTFYISYLAMGILLFVCTGSVIFIPETKNKPVLDNWDDDDNDDINHVHVHKENGVHFGGSKNAKKMKGVV